MSDVERFNAALQALSGRLSYKDLISAPKPVKIDQEDRFVNKGNGVFQMQDGEILAHFKRITDAANAVSIDRRSIEKVCRGKRKKAAGFQWCFA